MSNYALSDHFALDHFVGHSRAQMSYRQARRRPVFLLLQFASVWLLVSACTLAQAQQSAASNFSELDAATDWPWWRGPERNGLADARTPPIRFGVSENVIWKTPVPGRGHSSPVVVGQQVFLTTADEARQTQSVLAFDLATGAPQWQTLVSTGGFPAQNHPKNTEASSTAASDGKSLFTTFFHHKKIQLSKLSLEGQLVWQKDVGPFDPKTYEYGYAPSPLLYKNSVIVVSEYDGTSSMTAFDVDSGAELWRTPRPKNITFSSPVIANVAGREQLLLSGSQLVCAYDPANGRPLWQVEGTTAATCGTMVWTGDLVFASGGYPKAETIAVRADGSGQVVWRNNQKCYEQSMIVVDGYLYGLTDRGVLYCWNAQTGAEQWRERLSGPVSASPIFAGGHIYWANEAGTVYVFRPNPEKCELVAENRLGNEAFASPAPIGDQLLMRVAVKDNQSRQEFLFLLGKQ